VRHGITEDISKIRESVQNMINEALLKRATAAQEKSRRAAPQGRSVDMSSDGGTNTSGVDQSA